MKLKMRNNFNALSVKHKLKAAVGLYAHTEAKRMESQAKNKAPWTDRTSNSRNSILGDFFWDNNKAIITLSGNTMQFPYLELALEKKYAVLYPTINSNSAKIYKGYKKLVK
jgi:hypothetical protein